MGLEASFTLLLKESMEDDLRSILDGSIHPLKPPSDTCRDDEETRWLSSSPVWDPISFLPSSPVWDPISFRSPNWPRSNNQPGINSGVVSNQTNVSTAQSSQPPDISNASLLKRNFSSLSEPVKAQKKTKKEIDQAYREKCKNQKAMMQSELRMLTDENGSLKKENELLTRDNTLMNQTLRDKEKEIDRFRNDLFQLKSDYEKQNVLLQTLSGFLVDPVRLENEKLKYENASLRKNGNLNSNLSLLTEENAKLRIENKVLKVQNDALCGKIISDNDKKRAQESKIQFEDMPKITM